MARQAKVSKAAGKNRFTMRGLELLADSRIMIVIAAMLGAGIFLWVFGYQVLNVTNVDWLLAGGDLSQHYLGWAFYRNSPATFPIGVASDLAYPYGLAITFVDSIPLLAIPFKPIAALLPDHFQYFGWWGLLSFMAMAAITARTIQRWTKDVFIILVSAILLCVGTIMLQRMFAHTALAGHWIIMLGIYAFVWGSDWNVQRSVATWSIILSLSVLIHPYFLPMNICVMLLALIWRFKNIKRLAIEVSIPVLAAAVTTWVIGGFTFTSISGAKFGGAGYDLASPFVANGWSSLISTTATIHGEAFGYYGVGSLLLALIAIIYIFRNRMVVIRLLKSHRYKAMATVLLLVLLMVIALGPTIHFAGATIFAYDIPTKLERAWAVFRVTARLAWPIYYLVVLASVAVVLQYSRRPMMTRLFIGIVCLLQALDVLGSSQARAKQETFYRVNQTRYVSPLRDDRWQKLATSHQHILYLGEDLYGGNFVSIAEYAARYNLTLNTGYFARKPTKNILDTIDTARRNLASGNIDRDTIYVYDRPYIVAPGLQQTIIDGYVVTNIKE